MKISSILAALTVAVSAFVPMNVINNNEKCGLGLQQTRKICSACSVIGQLSIANQNRQMRLKVACLSLISNQCCSETTNRFLHWIFIEKAYIIWNKSKYNEYLRFTSDYLPSIQWLCTWVLTDPVKESILFFLHILASCLAPCLWLLSENGRKNIVRSRSLTITRWPRTNIKSKH